MLGKGAMVKAAYDDLLQLICTNLPPHMYKFAAFGFVVLPLLGVKCTIWVGDLYISG